MLTITWVSQDTIWWVLCNVSIALCGTNGSTMIQPVINCCQLIAMAKGAFDRLWGKKLSYMSFGVLRGDKGTWNKG
jgi:hypothetical protein